jgi:molybdopterin molybdotransferase
MPDGTLIPPTCCDTEPGLLPLAEARARLLRGVVPVAGTELLRLGAATGRLLADAPLAAIALPPFDQSAMDGYGLTAADLATGTVPLLVRRVAAGDAPGPALQPGQAVRLLTGAPAPEGVAAVVMQEHVTLTEGRVLAHRPVRPGDNLRYRGEDVAEGECLAEPGTRLDARHVALLAAAGLERVLVRRRLRVALLSNGNELRGIGAAREVAAVHDSNRPMLRALLAGPEIDCTDLGLLPDDPAALAAALAGAAAGHDLILASGGISGGDADHLPRALAAAGGEVAVLRLALKPGKPLAHGRLGDALCLFLPGNPLAALVTMLVLGRPLLARLAGGTVPAGAPPLAAVSAEAFSRRPGREEFLPACILGHDAAGLPLLARAGEAGSGRLLPLSRADGLLWLPAAAERVAPGDPLRFHPFSAAFGLG